MGRPRLEASNPALVGTVTQLVAQGLPVQQVAKRAGIARQTVASILSRNEDGFLASQKHVARKMLITTERSLDHISDAKLRASSAAQLMVVAGIGAQRSLELLQGHTAGVHVTINLANMLGEARNALAAIQATPVNVTPVPSTDGEQPAPEAKGEQPNPRTDKGDTSPSGSEPIIPL
jgi:hypothetical protein